MESIYYVMAWACHRRCKHCYEERFRPYVRGALDAVVPEAERNFPRIVDQFPRAHDAISTWTIRRADGQYPEKTGRVVLSGGESLLDAVRERVTYPVIERLQRRYAGAGGVKVVVQTTGDLLTDRIVDELLAARHLDDLGGQHRRLPCRARGRGQAARLHGPAVRAVPAPRHAPVRPVGDHAQLARGARAAVQLLRRHARFVDRQAVAARPRLAEQPAARDAGRQLLQPLVGRAELPAPSPTTAPRSRSSPTAASTPAASRPKLPIGNLCEEQR